MGVNRTSLDTAANMAAAVTAAAAAVTGAVTAQLHPEIATLQPKRAASEVDDLLAMEDGVLNSLRPSFQPSLRASLRPLQQSINASALDILIVDDSVLILKVS